MITTTTATTMICAAPARLRLVGITAPVPRCVSTRGSAPLPVGSTSPASQPTCARQAKRHAMPILSSCCPKGIAAAQGRRTSTNTSARTQKPVWGQTTQPCMPASPNRADWTLPVIFHGIMNRNLFVYLAYSKSPSFSRVGDLELFHVKGTSEGEEDATGSARDEASSKWFQVFEAHRWAPVTSASGGRRRT
jgi:hypothetical protein